MTKRQQRQRWLPWWTAATAAAGAGMAATSCSQGGGRCGRVAWKGTPRPPPPRMQGPAAGGVSGPPRRAPWCRVGSLPSAVNGGTTWRGGGVHHRGGAGPPAWSSSPRPSLRMRWWRWRGGGGGGGGADGLVSRPEMAAAMETPPGHLGGACAGGGADGGGGGRVGGTARHGRGIHVHHGGVFEFCRGGGGQEGLLQLAAAPLPLGLLV
ncbi:hypothetical protein I4F81_000402 [Pyropia yezoensis]|uniref:Uncharacterized protein n=1 Tax=Pyropia yezoensis TaxID=2788 RepID=A0ACC3BJX3_PYRYE|nr:hypothetical protein I4F81_000402 [Neopyropia yezoensis]